MDQEKCARVIITGTVQGVGFRWRARQAALSLGLSGWIKNRPDGGVEAVFQGPQALVDQMIEWVGVGPPGAVVREVMCLPCDSDPGRSDFLILKST
ncbi:MAG TPA: acylphosphatase [Synergistales bacterium]|nr:acylphosphatase [Synergistales bacterium]HRS48285.1 acylphosphatase [Thermovirgaceae bacterium]HRU90522.1 acylphosphatase [Thermovirgaceae bacterium]